MSDKTKTGSQEALLNQRHSNAETTGDKFHMVNANEEMVINHVRKMIEFMDMCKCEKCFKDVCAIVLNKMPARYVTTHKGTLLLQLPQMSRENHDEMSIMIAHALKLVSESPQH